MYKSASIGRGVEVIDYLGQAVQDVFNNFTQQRGKEMFFFSFKPLSL